MRYPDEVVWVLFFGRCMCERVESAGGRDGIWHPDLEGWHMEICVKKLQSNLWQDQRLVRIKNALSYFYFYYYYYYYYYTKYKHEYGYKNILHSYFIYGHRTGGTRAVSFLGFHCSKCVTATSHCSECVFATFLLSCVLQVITKEVMAFGQIGGLCLCAG
jgi:hypothetical protein